MYYHSTIFEAQQLHIDVIFVKIILHHDHKYNLLAFAISRQGTKEILSMSNLSSNNKDFFLIMSKGDGT